MFKKNSKESVEDKIFDAVEGNTKKIAIGVVGGLFAITTLMSSFYFQKTGEMSIITNAGGQLTAEMTPGMKFKMPFFSSVSHYNEYISIAFTDEADGSASSENAPFHLTFGDTYSGKLEGAFRFRLPQSPEKFISLHRAVKSERNLIGNTLLKSSKQLMQYTAPQFDGVGFYQGGQNEFRNRIVDQAENGLYVTKRKLVVQETDMAKAGLGADSSKVSTGQSAIYKNVILRDAEGKPLRKQTSLDEYGVTLAQFTMEEFHPSNELHKYATEKRDRVKERAKIIEEQQNERERAKTAEAKGERERIEAKQASLRQKDQAEIAANQQLELEKIAAKRETVQKNKEKELAAIDKAKELEIAEAERDIQTANAKAAIEQAKAIKAKGLAEAAVVKAKNDAIDRELYRLEKETEQIVAKAKAVAAANIVMPEQLIVSGDSSTGANSFETLMNLMTQQRLDEMKKAVANK